MKKLFTCYFFTVFAALNSYGQTPSCADTSCSFTQVLCASSQANGCVGDPYDRVLTVAVPSTIPSVRLNSLTGLPPGVIRTCAPANCTWNGGTRGCILVNGTPTAAGTYPLTANVRVFIIPPLFFKDTVFAAGTIVIDPVCLVNISGKIISEKNDSIAGVIVSLSGSATQKDTTGNNGRYSFDVPKGGSYTLIPNKKNDVAKTNGITAIDLALTKKHILSYDTLDTPYRIIAADVNASKSVTASDIALTQKVALGVDTVFTNGKLWRFVRSNFVFSNPLNPFTHDTSRSYTNLTKDTINQNFIGVKLGDANATWNPTIP